MAGKDQKTKEEEFKSEETEETRTMEEDEQQSEREESGSETSEEELGATELTARLEKEKERVLRLSAELENYKKRMENELKQFKKYANESLLKQLLTVIDNLERAIASAENEHNSESNGLLEGIKMTHDEILKLLKTFSVEPVKAEGEPFDPAYHQAVTQEETDEHPENTVVRELQKGYLMHDRLIRPSMVVVSKSSGKNDNEEKTDKDK
ncbi:MAG: nucleotide exchange factor GrpE [Desulfarculaceae bacterium]|nr:nucleotide exchange factor GrpE [Desulfarculaceae bacterium]